VSTDAASFAFFALTLGVVWLYLQLMNVWTRRLA